MRPYRVQIALASVALLVSAGITLAFPLVVRYLLDAAFVRASAPALNRIALILVALFAAQGLLNFGQVWVLTAAAERIIAKLRDEIGRAHV